MKKYILALTIVASLGFASCSSDDNAVAPDPETNILLGKWIPEMAYVDAIGTQLEEVYPHQAACEKDFLEIDEVETTFAYHDATCEIERFTDVYETDGDTISFNLMGSYVELEIVDNTEDTLRLKGTGEDFEALIPLLFPELVDSIPPGVLGLVTVELELSKEVN